MPLSSRLWLFCLAALGGTSCIGGPTSDYPFTDGPGKGGDNSDSDDDDNAGAPSDEGEDDDDGEPSKAPDPPVIGPRPMADAGITPVARDAGSVPLDAGAAAPPSGGDASVDGSAPDAAPDAMCTPQSDGRPAGSCFGTLCQTTLDALSSAAEPSGACSADADLALACDGEISRVVAACTQREVLSIGMGRAV